MPLYLNNKKIGGLNINKSEADSGGGAVEMCTVTFAGTDDDSEATLFNAYVSYASVDSDTGESYVVFASRIENISNVIHVVKNSIIVMYDNDYRLYGNVTTPYTFDYSQTNCIYIFTIDQDGTITFSL